MKKLLLLLVQTQGTFYSIRSTGEFCVIEVRKVSCSCESCLYDEGRQCLNQAYASEWKAINIATGKPVLEENFINEHWDPNAKKTKTSSDSNIDSNADSNTVPTPQIHVLNVRKRKQSTRNEQPPKQKVNWDKIYQEMEAKNTYCDLEHYVESVYLKIPNLYRPIIRFPRHCNIDR